MNKERLQKMATMMEEIVVGNWKATDIDSIPSQYREQILESGTTFNMHTWGAGFDDQDNELDGDERGSACGFAACAVGHALMDQRFENLVNYEPASIQPAHDGIMAWSALSRYFDIGDNEVRYLFDAESYLEDMLPDTEHHSADDVSPQEVLERLYQFIKDGHIPGVVKNA